MHLHGKSWEKLVLTFKLSSSTFLFGNINSTQEAKKCTQTQCSWISLPSSSLLSTFVFKKIDFTSTKGNIIHSAKSDIMSKEEIICGTVPSKQNSLGYHSLSGFPHYTIKIAEFYCACMVPCQSRVARPSWHRHLLIGDYKRCATRVWSGLYTKLVLRSLSGGGVN